MIVGIIGEAESGKDTVFQMIYDLWESKFTYTQDGKIHKYYHQEFVNKKFAGKVKDVCSILTGYPIETFYDRKKYNNVIPGLDISIRTLMQNVGDGLRNIVSDDVWIRAVFAKIREGHNVAFTDCRYPNEAQNIKELGGILIKIIRAEHKKETITVEQSNHPSENQVKDLPYDYLINNDGTLEDLRGKVSIIMNEIWNSKEEDS